MGVDMTVLMDDVAPGTASDAVDAGRPAGDCLRACVATVMGLAIEDVPHFVQYRQHPAGTEPLLWWWALVGFASAHGWRVGYVERQSPDEVGPEGVALASGISPRGHLHVVVVEDGALVHDPHPSRGGITEEDGWFTFERGTT